MICFIIFQNLLQHFNDGLQVVNDSWLKHAHMLDNDVKRIHGCAYNHVQHAVDPEQNEKPLQELNNLEFRVMCRSVNALVNKVSDLFSNMNG